MPDTLLKTKLYIPQARLQLVSRPRLIEQLDEGLYRKLTLISAPPGFGKTTLASHWLNSIFERSKSEETFPADSADTVLPTPSSIRHTSRFAWLSLDDHDNDPVRFWSYVIAALETTQPGIGTASMDLLHARQAPSIETTLTVLINAVADLSGKIILMLDDYHLITNESIHTTLAFLLDHLPPQLHLIMTSRTDPPLPLTRLRVRGQLTELRENDLRFTPSEIAEFLNRIMALDLSPDDVTALETRTEGWIAGLQLAALSMQGRADTQDFVRAFTGSHRYVIDYLAEEVLAQQPEDVQQFLLRTSILERLSAPLCDIVVGDWADENESTTSDNPDVIDNQLLTPNYRSQEMLSYLEQANLFLIPLDDERRWYRYHHLFADFLREHLKQTTSIAEILLLHQRAGLWYADNGFITEAINHALASDDNEQAARLIEQKTIPLLTQGEVGTLQNWLQKLPETLVRTRPRLTLSVAWIRIITRLELDDMDLLLEDAAKGVAALTEAVSVEEHGWSDLEIQGMQGELTAIQAMKVAFDGDLSQSIELCRYALEQLPLDNHLIRSVVTMHMGGVYQSIGDLNQASQTLAEAVSISRQSSGNVVTSMFASHNRAIIQEELGDLHQAAEFHRQAIQFATTRIEGREQPLPIAALGYVGLAEVLREWNELESAREHLATGMKLAAQGQQLAAIQIAHIILARTLQAQGKPAAALETIQQAELKNPEIPELAAWVSAVQARLWLIQGDLASAIRWAERCNLPRGDDFDVMSLPGEYTTLVRVFIAQERFEEAGALLQRLLSVAETDERWGRMPEIVMLQALTLYAQGNPEQALVPLTRALALAKRGGYIRIFVDEGAAMAQLLRLALGRNLPDQAYIHQLLAAFASSVSADPAATRAAKQQRVLSSSSARNQDDGFLFVEPLSGREMEVLHLIAAGLSNREIAEQLIITVGTAKTHTVNIYRKLDVNSRTQAVARATELGIM